MNNPRLLALALCATLGTVAGAQTFNVNPSSMHGWAFNATNGGAGSTTATGGMVEGPAAPPMGTGSAQFLTGANGDGAIRLHSGTFAGTRLDAITSLGYSTYVSDSSTGDLAPYLQMYVDYNGDSAFDDLLFFEPEYQSGYTGDVPNQGPLVNNTWQNWNALTGGWWSVFDTAGSGAGGSSVVTLAEILAIAGNENATIVNPSSVGGMRITAGFGAPTWNNFEGYADRFVFGTAAATRTYNFEAVPEPATLAALGIGALGLLRRRRARQA